MTTDDSARVTALNTVVSIAALALGMLLNLFLTPYLIRLLGVAVYGLIPLGNTLMSYMSILTASLTSAIGRHLTVDLVADPSTASETLSTAAATMSVAVLALLPLVVVGSFLAPSLMDIPTGHADDAQLYLLATGLAFLATAISSPFSASAYARNRLYLSSALTTLSTASRGILIVMLLWVFGPRLQYVSLATIGSAVLLGLGSYGLWRRLMPSATVSMRFVSLAKAKGVLSMSGWTMVDQMGTLLLLSIELLAVNRYYGAEAAGRFGAVLVLVSLIRAIGGAMSHVFGPIAARAYGRDERERLASLSLKATRVMALAMALPIGLLCGFSRPILARWLGTDYVDMAPLLVVLVAPWSANMAVQPLFATQRALNEVRWPGIATLLAGLSNAMLIVLAASQQWGGALAIAAIGSLLTTLRSSVFTPIYVARVQRLQWWYYQKSVGMGVLASAAVGGVSWFASEYVLSESLPIMAVFGGVVSLGYATMVHSVVLTRTERTLLAQLLRAGT